MGDDDGNIANGIIARITTQDVTKLGKIIADAGVRLDQIGPEKICPSIPQIKSITVGEVRGSEAS